MKAATMALALGLLAACDSESPPVWHNDLDEGLAVARAQHAAGVMVDVTATWCGPCKELAAAYETPVVRRALKRWVCVRVDVTRSDATSEAFIDQWSAGMPTVLFLDLDGREISRVRESMSPAMFAKRVPRR